ncbi:hypothetical protein [Aquimarina macrocephali]|nr:hypothetical protein [Aquimarina macrocephali]
MSKNLLIEVEQEIAKHILLKICTFCGGGSLFNGCCMGSPLVHQCLNDFG